MAAAPSELCDILPPHVRPVADQREDNIPSSIPDIVQRSGASTQSRTQPRASSSHHPYQAPQGFTGFRLTNTMVTDRRSNNQSRQVPPPNSSNLPSRRDEGRAGPSSSGREVSQRSSLSQPGASGGHRHPQSASNSRPVSSVSEDRGLVGNDNSGQPHGLDNPALLNPVLSTGDMQPGVHSPTRRHNNEPLPDLVDSHSLPPYVQARRNHHREARHQNQRRSRNQAQHTSRVSRVTPGTTQLEQEDQSWGCCDRGCNRDCCIDCLTVVTTFRWVLVSLSLLGVCCIVAGIVLGALHMAIGDSFLTLSLMFIGLGVMLVIVVGVGWRCTPNGHEPCHLLFNLGAHSPNVEAQRRRMRRRSRRHQWHGGVLVVCIITTGVLYPEFRNRRPPPTYSASQQDYEEHLAEARRQAEQEANDGDDNFSLPSSPPPTYRSHASTVRTGVDITFPPQPDSRPPTYRSHVSDAPEHVRPRLPGNVAEGASTSHASDVGVAMELESSHDDVVITVSSGESSSPSIQQSDSTSSGALTGTLGNDPSSNPGSGPSSTSGSAPTSTTSTMHRVLQAVRYFDEQSSSQSESQRSTAGSTSSSSMTQTTSNLGPSGQRSGSTSSRVNDTHL